jgi:hypothetical protein
MRVSEPTCLLSALSAAAFAAAFATACSESRTPSPVAPGCTFTVSLPTSAFGPSGGTGSASIATAGGCAWTASAAADWITFQGASGGSGAGTLAILVAPYVGAGPRSASLTIAGQSLTLTQSACEVGVSPAGQQFSDSGGVGEARIEAQPGCSWTVEDAASWTSIEPRAGVVRRR